MVFVRGEGLFTVSVLAAVCSSFCCRNFIMLLLGFCCKGGILGVELVVDVTPPPLSSFTQLGLEPTAGDGLRKAGLESDRVELRGGLLKGGLCPGPLDSGGCERGGFKGICCLLPIAGLLVVSSCVLPNLLARALVLLGSCASVSLLVDTVFFRKGGLGGTFIALPERLSKTGFFVGMAGPEERVGCRGCLGRPVGVEDVSSVLHPVDWKRAMMAFTSDLFSWSECKRIRGSVNDQNTKLQTDSELHCKEETK